MFAAAEPLQVTAPARSPDLDSEIAVLHSPECESLLRLIDCSRWHVARIDDAHELRAHLSAENCPVVICGPEDWPRVSAAARRSARPPGVVVLATHPNDREWLEVLESGGHYIPFNSLNPAKLFSLLNLLWRGWHRD